MKERDILDENRKKEDLKMPEGEDDVANLKLLTTTPVMRKRKLQNIPASPSPAMIPKHLLKTPVLTKGFE